MVLNGLQEFSNARRSDKHFVELSMVRDEGEENIPCSTMMLICLSPCAGFRKLDQSTFVSFLVFTSLFLDKHVCDSDRTWYWLCIQVFLSEWNWSFRCSLDWLRELIVAGKAGLSTLVPPPTVWMYRNSCQNFLVTFSAKIFLQL
ncbi:hypothetical protein KC19_VG298100 [Ceratodon purpureus]|uniref:Uncharacterized protein n=1 Tax=Ceratodon purpureus TaxID=3225 RepID=A0A8T0HW01_CERPU|nr:hypothetical protein KC19_VG298100 [Ceratodon purpureus]